MAADIHLSSALLLLASAALATAALISLLMPLLQRYALARPNARSSHSIPTPQGGGIAVVVIVAAVIVVQALQANAGGRAAWMFAVLAAMTVLALAGAVDDIRPLPVLPRLVLQVGAAMALVWSVPGGARILPVLPASIESALMVVGLVWFINLTNFMDGIDWMTVVQMVPSGLALSALALLGYVPELVPMLPVVLALTGALIGFAPFNRHVARLFLGDVGSLPIGALVGWLLIVLAGAGHLHAALILPLYYLADATVTLARRWQRGERLSEAHRSHFYQHAVQRGFSVPQVTTRVLALNTLLGLLAIVTVVSRTPILAHLALAAALAATALVLWQFERGQRRP
jgi:UDP-N-acetylmuramyl pentapeptide phosphotransferase/UDP-N-acetylglucosamine-1-phosphate transferase